jgi:hypothetical protein
VWRSSPADLKRRSGSRARHFTDDRIKLGGQTRANLRRRYRHWIPVGQAARKLAAGSYLVQSYSQRVDVRPPAELTVAKILGRHVRQRAADVFPGAFGGTTAENTKVDENRAFGSGRFARSNDDVPRLDVEVKDVTGMKEIKSLDDLLDDVEKRIGVARNIRRQDVARYVLSSEVQDAIGRVAPIEKHDAPVPEVEVAVVVRVYQVNLVVLQSSELPFEHDGSKGGVSFVEKQLRCVEAIVWSNQGRASWQEQKVVVAVRVDVRNVGDAERIAGREDGRHVFRERGVPEVPVKSWTVHQLRKRVAVEVHEMDRRIPPQRRISDTRIDSLGELSGAVVHVAVLLAALAELAAVQGAAVVAIAVARLQLVQMNPDGVPGQRGKSGLPSLLKSAAATGLGQ